MFRRLFALTVLCLFSTLSFAAPDDTPATTSAERACAGVTNEVTKGRQLNRELNAYAGQTVPEEVQQRVLKHLSLVARLKAECERSREQASVRK